MNLARRYARTFRQKSSLAKLIKAGAGSVTSKTVYDYVRKRDALAIKVHETASEMLGHACRFICNALSPDRIVLGGGVMKAGQVIIDEVSRCFPRYCWGAIAQRTEIVAAQCGEDAGILGAAAMVFEEFSSLTSA